MPASPESQKRFGMLHERLLSDRRAPLGDFERLVVGSKELSVSRSKFADSERLTRLPPGRPLKLLKLESIVEDEGEEGTLRACVALSQPETDSWRETYHSRIICGRFCSMAALTSRKQLRSPIVSTPKNKCQLNF